MRQFICLHVLIYVVITLASCRSNTSVQHPFADKTVRAIAQLSDERDVSGLSQYLTHANPTYSAYAALCFGSFGDSIPVAALMPLTLSADSAISHNAAWSIGQKGDSLSVPLLIDAWQKNPHNTSLLVALAKSIPSKTASTEHPGIRVFTHLDLTNTNILAGFTDASYHLHYRSIWIDTLFTKLLEAKWEGQDLWIRKAQSIGRYRKPLSSFQSKIIAGYLRQNPSVEISLGMLPSFNSLPDSLIREHALNRALSELEDQRVSLGYCHLLLRKFALDSSLWMRLMDTPHLGVKQAVLIHSVAQPFHVNFAKKAIEAIKGDSRFIPYHSYYSMKLGNESFQDFISQFRSCANEYDKIPFVPLIGKCEGGSDLLYAELFQTTHFGLRYALSEEWMRLNENSKSENALALWEKIWDLRDIGINALMCEKLPTLLVSSQNKEQWISRLENYKSTLQLPQEVETYEAIRVCLENLAPADRLPSAHDSSHPIDWDLVLQLPAEPIVQVQTSAGTFKMQFNLAAAPGSVSNMIALINSGFYNQKYFHRMVPNFVVQGGCPRGDGMGSTPYTIRSEFDRSTYTTGTIGLASSGRDTESCQWFVSHIPTPHLDGRYTIVGVVIEGMDIVQKLRVGDQIITMNGVNF